MDKKSVQAVLVTIFSGVLFLESMFAGGVASEETGLRCHAGAAQSK